MESLIKKNIYSSFKNYSVREEGTIIYINNELKEPHCYHSMK